MASSRKVYISASAFLAFVDRAHPKHQQAVAYFHYFGQNQYQLYTGFINISEAYREIGERISFSLAKDFLKAINYGNINILYPEETDMRAIFKAITNYSSSLTFKEASMSVMANKKGISQIC